MPTAYRCPHCGATLVETNREYRCESGHSFDRAREGYVNLLPGGRLKGRPAGDDEAMVKARRAVFDAGLYQPIIDRVAEVVHDSTSAIATAAATGERATGAVDVPDVLDVGCGEGSYLAAAVGRSGTAGWGIDISKVAVRLAARRDPGIHYAVASAYALPFADASFDAVINVFSPRDFSEMSRVLRPRGAMVVVTPGPGHLRELKAALYDEARTHDTADEHATAVLHEELVSFAVALPRAELRLALLQMTPFWWSATPARRDLVAARVDAVSIEMRLTVHSPLG